jgi:hypothetical protein
MIFINRGHAFENKICYYKQGNKIYLCNKALSKIQISLKDWCFIF